MKTKILLPVALVTMLITAAFTFAQNKPIPGAEQTSEYIKLIKGKTIAIVANQTSTIGDSHLVDKLTSLNIKIKAIFAPEHGFRDLADAGATIEDGKDKKTGIPIISLYGKQVKPTPEDLEGVDVVIYDIQDVGTRFYTYITTLHYIVEACAENHIKCIVLDRPNPNGFYIDGNVLDTAYKSFVGIDPVPVVHGMTIGEYAMMINGEGWLKGGVKCDLKVVKCRNYNHKTRYELPVKPSPNLPNYNSVLLYPSLCFFEGTKISVGRGTSFPFQVFGSPELPDKGFSFTPESVPGAMKPNYKGVKCYGTDLRKALDEKIVPDPGLNLSWVISAYNEYPDKEKFFTSYFDVLAGGPGLREMIIKGMTSEEIRATWKKDLEKFNQTRRKYLLYKE